VSWLLTKADAKSNSDWLLAGGSIRYGLMCIGGVGVHKHRCAISRDKYFSKCV